MKRTLSVLLVFPIMWSLCFLSSCRAEKGFNCIEALSELCGGEAGKRCTLYDYSGYLISAENRSLLARLFGAEDLPGEWAAVRQAAAALGRATDGYEIWLLEAKHSSELPRLEDLLRRRVKLLQSPDVERFAGERYFDCISSANVYVFGNFICLLSTPDNAAVLRALTEKQKE